MQRSSNRNPDSKIFWVFLFCFILITTSCKEPVTPLKDKTSTEPPSSTSTDQVTDLLAFVPKISAGQHLRFDRISLEQGLSQSTVFCMLQDSQGFMWFGTEDGLNKFDGYTFTVYKHVPDDPKSLSGSWIQALLEDDLGMLWIGTNGGLSRYDRTLDQFTNYRHDPDDPSSLSDNVITALYEDREGVLWIGTGGGGLEKYNQENDRFIHYQHNPIDVNSLSSNAVTSIYEDKYGSLWIGTLDGGLNEFDRNDYWQRYVSNPSDSNSLSHNAITSISEDSSGMLWIGTDGGGLEVFDREKGKFKHYRNNPDDPDSLSNDKVRVIFQDREGILWVGAYGGGVNRFDLEKKTFAHYQNVPGELHSLSSDIVLSVFQDQEGVLWFGTIGGGVSKLGVERWNFAHYKNNPNDPNSLGNNMIRDFYQDKDGIIWIGTTAGGLTRFDRKTGSWHHFLHDPDDPDSLGSNWVHVIYEDSSGVLWLGTSQSLDRFDPESDTTNENSSFTHFQPGPEIFPGAPNIFISRVYETKDGGFWIGTNPGLLLFDRQEEIWTSYYQNEPGNPGSLSVGWVDDIMEDSQGRMWIGMFGGGLNRFDPETESFTRYENDPGNPQSLRNNQIGEILQDQEGIIWIGTHSGFSKFDPENETFSHYLEKDGLPNETIYCMIEDTLGYLWISTNKGLSRFDPQTETFRNYDVTDGLQSNEFNGNACCIDGFNSFFPNNIRDNPIIPPVVLTSLTQNGVDVDLGINIDNVTEDTIMWPDNAFEFEFAALSYAYTEKNQYAYYLEGFEETWNEVGTRRYGKYTNLPGGTYTLHVKGSNNDGVWNEIGTTLEITIVPPFWATWWFRGMLISALAMAIFGGYKWRVSNLETSRRDLESQVEQRTFELMKTQEVLKERDMENAITAERSRLARELHDSVTQSLHSSTLLAEAGQRLAGTGDIERARGYLIRLGDISQQALREMRLLIYELRPLALSGVGLVRALQQRLDAVERRSGVEVQLSLGEELELPESIEEELFRIALEALNNALKHANPTLVTVTLRKEVRREIPCIELSIIDDGIGFNPDKEGDEGGLGLVSMKERIEILGGELDILSSPGEGTQVKVSVDLKTPAQSTDAQEVST